METTEINGSSVLYFSSRLLNLKLKYCDEAHTSRTVRLEIQKVYKDNTHHGFHVGELVLFAKTPDYENVKIYSTLRCGCSCGFSLQGLWYSSEEMLTETEEDQYYQNFGELTDLFNKASKEKQELMLRILRAL